jgi:hypothetical protein
MAQMREIATGLNLPFGVVWHMSGLEVRRHALKSDKPIVFLNFFLRTCVGADVVSTNRRRLDDD